MAEKDTGPCEAEFYRWYFNHETGLCEEFVYGGCRGNGNRFLSKAECENTCDKLLQKKPISMIFHLIEFLYFALLYQLFMCCSHPIVFFIIL